MNIKMLLKKVPRFKRLIHQRDEYYNKTLKLEKQLEEQCNMSSNLQETMKSIS